MERTTAKAERLLMIYSRLVNGDTLSKQELAQQFHVTERSIQRDMESLRYFFAEQRLWQDIVYDRDSKGYRLESPAQSLLTNSEILAVCKILLESRSMRRDEMLPIHYIEPHHGKHILPGLWEMGQAIQEQRVVEIEYERIKEPKQVRRRVLPVGIMFSEYYFYLTAFLEDKSHFENPDDLFPTIYRLDRIQSFQVLDERFQIHYKDRFQEGEFRKRVQFMYGGKLERVKFKYTGPSIEAVLDRLPTARILEQDEEGWTVEAEVFGKGIEMWVRSQGPYIKLYKGV